MSWAWRFLLLFPILRVLSVEDCPAGSTSGSGSCLAVRAASASTPFEDVVGLEGAKAVLQEAIILPAKMAGDMARLFWRSGERSAVLLAGPEGLGKRAAAEAAAAVAGAEVMHLLARAVASGSFCRVASSSAKSSGKPVVVIVEALESAPEAALAIRQCLREAAGPVSIVATMGSDPSRTLNAIELSPFGYLVRLPAPSQVERKQFLLRLLAQVSRVDAQWGSALRESAVETLANLTDSYTFSEIDFVIRRAFLRSTTKEGARDPVALHHFEKILADTPATAVEGYESFARTEESTSTKVEGPREPRTKGDSAKKDKDGKKKEGKDPMESIFGWCNMWLPEPLHLPPVVWAVIVFGILAHLMARTTYQPYGGRGRRGRGGTMGGPGSRSSLFSDMPGGSPYSSFGDQLGEWPLGGSNPFGGFPSPPGGSLASRAGDASSLFSPEAAQQAVDSARAAQAAAAQAQAAAAAAPAATAGATPSKSSASPVASSTL